MSSLSSDANEITALASETHLNEIQFAEPLSRNALETLEEKILSKRHDFEVSFTGFTAPSVILGSFNSSPRFPESRNHTAARFQFSRTIAADAGHALSRRNAIKEFVPEGAFALLLLQDLPN